MTRSTAAEPADPARRAVLKAGAAAGGALLFGFYLPVGQGASRQAQAGATVFETNAFSRIDRQGVVTLVMPQVEMGQGIYTAVAMILAEELDAAFERVVLEHAPPNDKLYGNPVFGIQVTGNSNSVRAFWTPLRKAGAGARAMLVQAAAQQWKVNPASCTAADGQVRHIGSGRKSGFGTLAGAASKLAPPKNPPLKDPKNFTLIGKSLKRLDTPRKVDGGVVYGIDVMLPGMKFATLAASPVFGGKVDHVDPGPANKIPGVRKVVVLDDMVAVVGDHMWAAKQGLRALDITWNEGANAAVSSAHIWEDLRAASRKDGAVAKNEGDVEKARSRGEKSADDEQRP